jgi:putative phosphoesterase
VLLLADTHIGPSRPSRRLPDGVYSLLVDGVDAIVHAGDVVAQSLLDELSGFAPVHAVLGNNDVEPRLPSQLVVSLDGVSVGVVHDSGPRAGREARLRRWFPSCDVVVFGHSHQPWHEVDPGGQHSINPGSPTDRRMAPTRTVGLLTLSVGRVAGYELLDV